MGGKAKQAQRTKNNSRPSNSGRSAELLGASIPSFVGFSAHSGLGILPLAPGFLLEPLPDNFDATIDPQFQVVLRKMSKKDPVTKVKALQEFTELITTADLTTIKAILPLWPKFYLSVANDVEHRVREAAQQAQLAVVDLAGKNIAPFLKHLVPVWITSQFDNYAPAAHIAASSFRSAFPPRKLKEVFIFCQSEIVDYVTKNLTVHTASTLCTSKTYTEEEAESKYQRVVICSLRAYALYLMNTPADKIEEINAKNETLLQNQKFWSFAKHKVPNVRAAWFESISSLLQNTPQLLESYKQQLISLIFQNMADTDPVVLPQVWCCIILVQNTFSDWHVYVNLKKVVVPKLLLLLKNGGNGSATSLCPHYLPFISNLTEENIQGYSLDDFYNDFFRTMKTWFTATTHGSLASKSELTANIVAFYECLRYVIKRKAVDIKNIVYTQNLLEEYVIDTIKWSVVNENAFSKHLYAQISSLITFWTQTMNTSEFYSNLVGSFWKKLQEIVQSNESQYVTHTQSQQFVELLENLYNSAPNLQDNKVKFALDDNTTDKSKLKNKQIDPFLRTNLKEICIALAKIFVARTTKENTSVYVMQLQSLCRMFNDIEFYSKISSNDFVATINILISWLNNDIISEPIIDIIFDILQLLDKAARMNYLNQLLTVTNPLVQQWILQRFLSYPLCLDPEIRDMLSKPQVSKIILRIAADVIKENSKDKFNLLHKCFFQIDSGDILIDKSTVDGIIGIMSEPLTNESQINMLDTCGSFIAQIMPVICANNATENLQREVFLKLFKFSVNMSESDNLSEDTLWEITTCWQDSLSSGDIKFNDSLISKCLSIIQERISIVNSDSLLISDINNIAEITAKLILCSTENIQSEEERYRVIDNLLESLLTNRLGSTFDQVENFCSYAECLQGIFTPGIIKSNATFGNSEITDLFRTHFFEFSTILKLTCNVKRESKSEERSDCNRDDEQESNRDEEQEYTEDYCDPNENLIKVWSERVYMCIMEAMRAAGVGESLILNSQLLDDNVTDLILNLSEKIKILLTSSTEEHTTLIKEKIWCKINEGGESWSRLLPFLLVIKPYDGRENGPILLYEDSIDSITEINQMLPYLNILQVMLPKLPLKTLPINVMFCQNENILMRVASMRSYITNHFSSDYSELIDKKLISFCFDTIMEIAAKQQANKDYLLYNQDITKTPFEQVMTVVEIANFFTEIINNFPSELDMKHWDLIRIALSSWTLTTSKNVEQFRLPQVSIFITAVYKLHAAMFRFVTEERTKSSTVELTNLIDEWDNFFSLEISLVLFKSFYNILTTSDLSSEISDNALLDVLCPCMEYFDYSLIYNACKSGFKISLDECIEFLFNQLSNREHSVRVAAAGIFHKLIDFLVIMDLEKLEKQIENVERKTADEWHLFCKISRFALKYENEAKGYLKDFSYKLTEIACLSPVERDVMMPYLLLWDCIVLVCSKASPELRSFYANWITENQFEQTLLQLLFRSMPIEILKNYDSKVVNNDMFKLLDWKQITDRDLLIERYACHMYAQMLRYLPAVVRKWWNEANPRQKTFVDKLTTNYISSLICQEELRAISNKKEKHENMQITVHTSTREVIATYSIDEARMELVIALAANHPLGSAKIESEKQIGGRLQSRVVVRQLTIFLTHQNGSIFDVLSLWKKNLDKKFEGVEECYVCYSVIHQDTCQLPKLSCKTCRKKFHGPCLYKWFTTSSKSTCPICRNVF